jgi:hypothetical protein
LASLSFAKFVQTAEEPEVAKRWIEEMQESLWRYVRIPIFVIFLLLLSLLIYSATESFQSLLALLPGVLGLIPLLIRNVAAVRGGTTVTTQD